MEPLAYIEITWQVLTKTQHGTFINHICSIKIYVGRNILQATEAPCKRDISLLCVWCLRVRWNSEAHIVTVKQTTREISSLHWSKASNKRINSHHWLHRQTQKRPLTFYIKQIAPELYQCLCEASDFSWVYRVFLCGYGRDSLRRMVIRLCPYPLLRNDWTTAQVCLAVLRWSTVIKKIYFIIFLYCPGL